jgi:hypothetical protein
MTPASDREPPAGGSPAAEIDLAAAGAAMDMRSRPAREVDLKDIVPLRAIALRNDHQLQLIKVVTGSIVSIVFTVSLCLILWQSAAGERANVLRELQPYLAAILGFAGGAASARWRSHGE